MAAESCGMCLFEAMDQIWFGQIIIFSENTLFPTSKSTKYSSKNISQMSFIISGQQISSASSVTACSKSQVESKIQERDHVQETTTTTAEDRPTRLNFVSRKTRSHSSSLKSAKKQSRNLERVDFAERGLQKTGSCKSLGDLELEEVKGFMDLGFVFKKENLSSHVISLIPGLQRINAYKTMEQDSRENSDRDEDEEKKGKMRSYLSEAWLVKRHDSPLILSLRISRVYNDSDMVKKHLKNWARTVAAAIQQES